MCQLGQCVVWASYYLWNHLTMNSEALEYEIVDLKPPNIVYLQNTYLFFKKSVAPPYPLLMCWNTIWDSKVSKGGCCVQILCVEGGSSVIKPFGGVKWVQILSGGVSFRFLVYVIPNFCGLLKNQIFTPMVDKFKKYLANKNATSKMILTHCQTVSKIGQIKEG